MEIVVFTPVAFFFFFFFFAQWNSSPSRPRQSEIVLRLFPGVVAPCQLLSLDWPVRLLVTQAPFTKPALISEPRGALVLEF